MATNFSGTSQYLRRTISLPLATVSASLWFRWLTDRNDYSAVWGWSEGSNNHSITTQSDGSTLSLYVSDYATYWTPAIGASALTIGQWAWCAVSIASGAQRFYFAASSAAAPTGSTATWAIDGRTATIFSIGDGGDASSNFAGDVAHVKTWTAALTDNELLQERWSAQPVRRANLHSYYPLRPGTDRLTDYSGAGLSLTATGTPTNSTSDPPVFYRTSAIDFFPPAAAVGGGTMPVLSMHNNSIQLLG